MDNFTFCGRHIREFGAEAAFGEAMRYGGKVQRGLYPLPGGGSVAIGEDVRQPTTRQVTIIPADGREADEKWRREITGWLQGGRGEMIVDSDPDVILIARFDADGVYGTRSWPAGGLEMTMTIEPLAYSALRAQGAAHAADDVETDVPLDMDSALPVPLDVHIACTSGTITKICVSVGSHVLELPSAALQSGHEIEYDGGEYLHDVVDLRVDGETDFSPAQGGRWSRLFYRPETDVISVTVTGGEADVKVSARGRFNA